MTGKSGLGARGGGKRAESRRGERGTGIARQRRMSSNERPRKRIARPLLLAAAGASVLLARGCLDGGSGNLIYRPPVDMSADLANPVDEGVDQKPPPADGEAPDGEAHD